MPISSGHSAPSSLAHTTPLMLPDEDMCFFSNSSAPLRHAQNSEEPPVQRSSELWQWLNNGQEECDAGSRGPPQPLPPPPPPLPLPLPLAVDPNCPRGGKRARLLRQAAEHTRAEAQQHHQWNIEERYLQEPDLPKEPNLPEEQGEEVHGGAVASTSSANHLYPFTSSIPVSEEPPWDDAMRQLLASVLTQARNCLPGLSVAHKKGVTNPDEVLKYILEGKVAPDADRGQQPTPQPQSHRNPQLGSPDDGTLWNIVLTVKTCEQAEIADAILQLHYWLNSIKLACLLNK